MTPSKIFVYGTGSLAEKIYYYNKRDKLYDLVGFIDDNKVATNQRFCDLPVLTYNEFKKAYDNSNVGIFVAIGYVKCNKYRENVCNIVATDGYKLVNYVSPNSICFPDTIDGDNILVCDNVFIGHGSKVKSGVILSVGCVLSHENTIGPYTFISSVVVFGGHAKVANNCFVGLHSTLKDGIEISEYNIVGSGSNVIHSTPPFSVTVGNPGVSITKDTMSIKI